MNLVRRKRILFALGLVLFLGLIGSATTSHPSTLSSSASSTQTTRKQPTPTKPLCDGSTITSNCTLDGVSYKTYIYHPAVAEQSHTEQVTTYQEKVTGYCTLCNDGTYSPSCATGRGACSWHGGVAEWNAPISSKVPVYTSKTVIDAPAQDAYFEKSR